MNSICNLISISADDFNTEMKRYHKDILLSAKQYRDIVQKTVDESKEKIKSELGKYHDIDSLKQYALEEIEKRDNATALDYLKHIDNFRHYRDQD